MTTNLLSVIAQMADELKCSIEMLRAVAHCTKDPTTASGLFAQAELADVALTAGREALKQGEASEFDSPLSDLKEPGIVADVQTLRFAFVILAFAIQNKTPELPADFKDVARDALKWIDGVAPDDFDIVNEACDLLRKHNSSNL